MQSKILITCLSAHWAIVFAYGAAGGATAGVENRMDLAFAVCHALAAALFLWTALASCVGRQGDARYAAGFAIAIAALTLTSEAATDGNGQMVAAAQMAALGVTYLVIRTQDKAAIRQPEEDWSGEIARRLAMAAAHGSMLTRLSGRSAGERDA